MPAWRYIAVEAGGLVRRGELVGDSAADVRASLRRIGLRVIDLHDATVGGPWLNRLLPTRWLASIPNHSHAIAWREPLWGHMRRRRTEARAELYDSFATMLEAGVPLLEAVTAILGESAAPRTSAFRGMLIDVREGLRAGSSLGQMVRNHPSWFDSIEVAMIEAGQHSGTLPVVLRALAQRQEERGQLSQKLTTALAYPVIVALVGIAVALFLSLKTLPQLAGILTDAGVEVPALTQTVMGLGQFIASQASWIVIAAILVSLVGLACRRWAGLAIGAGAGTGAGAGGPGKPMARLTPKVFRRLAASELALRLADLLRTGVPMVDALRIVAPTMRGAALPPILTSAAARVERGEEVSAALDHELFFDGEFRRLLDIGQSSGELPDVLERIGHRYARQARRLIDRLTALLEPAVILTLAVLVGLVVMSAILPLMRLQEVL